MGIIQATLKSVTPASSVCANVSCSSVKAFVEEDQLKNNEGVKIDHLNVATLNEVKEPEVILESKDLTIGNLSDSLRDELQKDLHYSSPLCCKNLKQPAKHSVLRKILMKCLCYNLSATNERTILFILLEQSEKYKTVEDENYSLAYDLDPEAMQKVFEEIEYKSPFCCFSLNFQDLKKNWWNFVKWCFCFKPVIFDNIYCENFDAEAYRKEVTKRNRIVDDVSLGFSCGTASTCTFEDERHFSETNIVEEPTDFYPLNID